MPRKLPPKVERNFVKGKSYYYFRIGKGARTRLPELDSPEFGRAYAAAMAGDVELTVKKDAPGTIGALIGSYFRSAGYKELRDTSKTGYRSRLKRMREDHGHRTLAGLTRDRIIAKILEPLAGKPAAALDTLKKLRILIRHAIDSGQLKSDPSIAIKRPKTREIRAWSDAEMAAFELRWPIGTKQRTAYAIMLNMGTARVDIHQLTWRQVDEEASYTRRKTGVPVQMAVSEDLRKALEATPRNHVTVINTEFGKPFTVNGYSGFMRDAINAAGLPLDCKPHGLRKTLGRLLADAGVSAHDIMAAMGHTTLAEAERYTREADRRRGGTRAMMRLNDHMANRISQTASEGLGEVVKNERKST